MGTLTVTNPGKACKQYPACRSRACMAKSAPATVLSITLCVLGMHLLRKHAGEMVDEL